MSKMSWTMSMIRHPKAAREFGVFLHAILPVMTDPEVSTIEKRKTLNMMVKELSEDTFKLEPIAEQIMTIINMKKEVCQEYTDSEAQVKGILLWLPRMKEHRFLLYEEVRKHREEHGLKV